MRQAGDAGQVAANDTARMRAIPTGSLRTRLNEECRQRLEWLREQMSIERLDYVVVTNPENMLYYTGYYTKGGHASQFIVIDKTGRVTVITRASEIANIARSGDAGAAIDGCLCYSEETRPVDALRDVLRINADTRVGVEMASRWFQTSYYLSIVALVGPDRVVGVAELLAAPRRKKSSVEVEAMRRAGRITVDAIRETMEVVEPGVTDYMLAATALNASIRRGSEWSATWPNIGVGAVSGVGHGSWSGAQVSGGDTVAVELGGVVERYHTPACRTALLEPITPHVSKAAGALTEACAAGLEAVRGGTEARSVYVAFFDVLKAAGVSDILTYPSYGYMTGVGFPPTWANEFGESISAHSDFILEPGMTFHMLAFLMEPNRWGIGHSDTILVTDVGYESLTSGLPSGPIPRGAARRTKTSSFATERLS